MKKKIIWSIAVLIIFCSLFGFYRYYRLIANNEAGICAETGTRLSEQELRSRVIENFLWQMLKKTDADKNDLINHNIAVVNRHIGKDEIISMIENSSGKQFIQDIINNPETVLFTYSDVRQYSPGFLAALLSPRYGEENKHNPMLINKIAKARTMFNGDFSIVTYNARHADPWFQENNKYGGIISITPGNAIFLNNDSFRNRFRNFSISKNKVSYITENKYNKIGYNENTYTAVRNNIIMPYDHAYGRFFYQYYSNSFGINYNDLYSSISNEKEYINDEEERKKKILEAKDESIRHLINESQPQSLYFFAVSNCGDIFEYYTESPASGYLVMDRF